MESTNLIKQYQKSVFHRIFNLEKNRRTFFFLIMNRLLIIVIVISVMLLSSTSGVSAQQVKPPVNCTPSGVGLSDPTALCLPGNPCTALLSKYTSMGITSITTAMFTQYQCQGWIQDPVTKKWTN